MKINANDEPDVLGQFEELYKVYAPRLIYYAGRYVDSDTAEDLVQDIYMKLWQKRLFSKMEEKSLKSYLYHSVQNACLDLLRHQEVEGDYVQSMTLKWQIEGIYYNDNPEWLLGDDERMPRVLREIQKLPEKCREIFMMSYMEERKTAEIAKMLEVSPRTVEAQLYKALKTLRGALISLLIFSLIFFGFA